MNIDVLIKKDTNGFEGFSCFLGIKVCDLWYKGHYRHENHEALTRLSAFHLKNILGE